MRNVGATAVPGTVDLVEALGAETLIYVSTQIGRAICGAPERTAPSLHAGQST